MAVTAATAHALRDIRPDDVDPAAPVFGLTGETLANRVRAAARVAGLGDGCHRTQRPHRDGSADGGGGCPQRSGAASGPMEARRHGGPLHPGEAAGEALKWLS